MDLQALLGSEEEKPLDRLVTDGGFCGIFRTIGCVGDSLSSGEFESLDEKGNIGYHDYFDYSWGQYIARSAGCTVCNFSRGGMTAKEYMETFALENDFWNPKKACQAYIIALGVNDLMNFHQPVGSVADIDAEDYTRNAATFTGYYAAIIQRLKAIQPKARFFLVTMPGDMGEENNALADAHAAVLHELAKRFDFTYVVDLRRWAPAYDETFKKNFYLGGHMSAAGYLLTARMIESYIDYIIRHNMADFAQIGFVGTPFHNSSAKW